MADVKLHTPRAHVIFCDDIRQEIGGKVSYMGVVLGELSIPKSAPHTLPKFCISITYFERPGDSSEMVTFEVEGPLLVGDRELKFPVDIDAFRGAPLPSDPEAGDPMYAISMNLEIAPMIITQSGRIRVYARVGKKRLKLASLLFKLKDS